jgi:hypothetical protein
MAYLRLWREKDKGKTGWRASLENAHTGERRGFASLGELFAFLEKEVCQAAHDQAAPGAGEKGGDSDDHDPTNPRLRLR